MSATQPLWVQAETYDAVDARLGDTALLGPTSTTLNRGGGVVPGYGGALAVTQTGSPSMAVLVATGAATVPSATSEQGNYRLGNDASLTVNIAAATSQARVDLVIARVYDTGSAGTSGGAFEIVQGSPGAGVPAMPAGAHAYKLAEVTVGANVTSITTGNITDRRTWAVAPGGLQPVVSTAMPANPYDGQAVVQTNTNLLAVWFATGAAWRTVPTGSAGAWTAYTPAWTASGVNPSPGNSVIVGRYTQTGKTVHFSVSITVGGTGFGTGSGFYSVSLPPGLPAVSVADLRFACPAYFFDTSAATEQLGHYVGTGIIGAAATVVTRIRFTSAVDGGPNGGSWAATSPVIPNNGDEMILSGTYETSA